MMYLNNKTIYIKWLCYLIPSITIIFIKKETILFIKSGSVRRPNKRESEERVNLIKQCMSIFIVK